MLDTTGIIQELTKEIDYAIDETQKTMDRRDAHNWAKGYRKGLVFARDLLQDKVVLDLTQEDELEAKREEKRTSV
jgi:hypothetical protein